MSTRSLGQLTLDLVTQTGGWVQGMNKAERSSKRWRKQVNKDLKLVGKAFAGAATLAAGGLTALTVSGQTFVDSQAKTAARLGTTIDGLRAVQIAASDFDIDQERLGKTLQSYTKRLGDAVRGTGEAQKAYKALGIEAAELARLPLPEQLALIAERIAELDTAAERSSIADRLMSGGRTMVNLFEEGGDAIRAAVDEVNEYGLALSEVDAAKVEAANDAMSRIPRLLEPIKTQLAVAVAEPLQGITNEFLEAGKASGGFRDDIHEMVDDVVGGLLFVIDAGDGIGRAFELAGAGIALMVIDAQRDLATLAESIYSGPVDAINFLIEGLNKTTGTSFDLVGQPGFVKDLQQQMALLEGASQAAREDIQDILMAPMASEGIRDAIEAARNPPTLGGDGEGMISTAAIAAAETVASAMGRLGDAANDSADADEDKTDASKTATDAVKDLGDASSGASRALAAIGSGDWGRGTLGAMKGEQDNGGRSVRQRIEAGKDLSAYALEPNPNAKPTWSSDYLTNPESDLAEKVSASARWSSVGASSGYQDTIAWAGSGDMQESAGGKRVPITLKLATEDGEEEIEGEVSENVVDLLEKAAAGTSAR